MTKPAEQSGLGVIKGHGADSGRAVADPQTGFILLVRSLYRGKTDSKFQVAAADAPFQNAPAAVFDAVGDFADGVDRFSVDGKQDIADANTGFFCGIIQPGCCLHLGKSHDQYAVGIHFDTERRAAGNDDRRVDDGSHGAL